MDTIQHYTHRVPGLNEGRHKDPDGVIREECGGDDADGEPQRLVVHLSVVSSSLFFLLSRAPRDLCSPHPLPQAPLVDVDSDMSTVPPPA